MTKKELLRRERLSETLAGLGFDEHEAEALRRISGTLKRWHEMECGTEGGCIERDGDTGRPYWVSEWGTRPAPSGGIDRGPQRQERGQRAGGLHPNRPARRSPVHPEAGRRARGRGSGRVLLTRYLCLLKGRP
jgi:hypothetical protein